MPTPTDPRTRLGTAIRAHRGDSSLRSVSDSAGIPWATLARIERGQNGPTYDTARALAAWLGWTLEQVFEAAEQPAD